MQKYVEAQQASQNGARGCRRWRAINIEQGGPAKDHLLDLGGAEQAYNSGQPPPVRDQELLRHLDIDDTDEAQPRPSTSYDDFVGGRPQAAAPGHSGEPSTSRPFNAPYMTDGNRDVFTNVRSAQLL